LEVQVTVKTWLKAKLPGGTGPTCLVLSLTVGMWSCGGGTPMQPPLQPSVSISPTSAIVAADGQQQFTANTAVSWQVNGVTGGSTATGTISSGGLYTAPEVALSVTVKAVSQADTAKSASAGLAVLAPHRIGVRSSSSGFAEFYDRSTGNSFTPRGNNYIRLASQVDSSGNATFYHSTFNVGLYDPDRADTALAQMQTNGYNAVRIFLNGCCPNSIGDAAGGLSTAYIANLVDFLEKAKAHSVYAIITIDWLPSYGGYSDHYANCTQFSSYNTLNLCAGGVEGNAAFFHDLVAALIVHSAALDSVLAYELRNEYYNESDHAPLNQTSGMVTAANGTSYDMSSPTSQQQMMDDGLTYFTDQVRAAIVALDPTALVTVGFFWPQQPNPTRIGDPRLISVYPAIANSTADFVDIHGYSVPGDLTVPQLVQNYGFIGYQQQKPVFMGEFGAFKSDYPIISDAAAALQSWQTDTCPYQVKGWLLWTWDTDDSEEGTSGWTALSGDGLVNSVLAPIFRPDPCQ
jgi:hypothetical protein